MPIFCWELRASVAPTVTDLDRAITRHITDKFASGRVSELIDSEVVFRGFSSCEDSVRAQVDRLRSGVGLIYPGKSDKCQ